MKMTIKSLVCLGAVGTITAAVLLTGCQSSSSTRSAGQKMSDRDVASSLKKGLEDDPTFKYTNVKANVYEGAIQLNGWVETSEQRLRAAEIASHVKGTKQVINNIMITPMPTGPATVRDPLGQDTGRLLLDTNSPVMQLRNLPPEATKPPGQATGTSGEGTNPK
jgi:hypothetical protein